MSVGSARSAFEASRTTVGWVVAGVLLYLPLLAATPMFGVARGEAALGLGLSVVAALWGVRDLTRVTQWGPVVMLSGLLLLMASGLGISGAFTPWPPNEQVVTGLFLLVGMIASLSIQYERTS